MTLLTHPVRAAGTRLPVVIRSALICFALLSVNVACDDNNQMDDKRGAVDAGDDCPSGWHAASYYTEPGCDPAPSRRQVCAPDQWDAGCQQVCSCDGEIRCAAVFGNATSWDYGSSEPYSQADPFLDCELSTDDDTDDTETDDLTEGGPDDTAPDDPTDDDPTDDDQTTTTQPTTTKLTTTQARRQTTSSTVALATPQMATLQMAVQQTTILLLQIQPTPATAAPPIFPKPAPGRSPTAA